MLKGPLASLERHDRPAFEGRSGSERSTEPGSSAKTVASQPVVGYRIRSRTAKKEILVEGAIFELEYADNYFDVMPRRGHLFGARFSNDASLLGECSPAKTWSVCGRQPRQGRWLKHPDIELPKPSMVGIGGFLLAWVAVGLIVWLPFWLSRL